MMNPLLTPTAANFGRWLRRTSRQFDPLSFLPFLRKVGRFYYRHDWRNVTAMLIVCSGGLALACVAFVATYFILRWTGLPFLGFHRAETFPLHLLQTFALVAGVMFFCLGCLFVFIMTVPFCVSLGSLWHLGLLQATLGWATHKVVADDRNNEDEIAAWAEENAVAFWLNWHTTFYFASLTDAIYFKLRWVG